MWLLLFVTTCLVAHGFSLQGSITSGDHSDKLKIFSEIIDHIHSSSKPISKEEMPRVRRRRYVDEPSYNEESLDRNRRQAVYEDAGKRIAEDLEMQEDSLMLQNQEYHKRTRGVHDNQHHNSSPKRNLRKNPSKSEKTRIHRINILRHLVGLKLFEKRKGTKTKQPNKNVHSILKKPGSVATATKGQKRVRINDERDNHREHNYNNNNDHKEIERDRRSTKKKSSAKKGKKPKVFLVVKKIPFIKDGRVEYKYIVLKKLYVGSGLANKIRANKRFVKKRKIGIVWKPPPVMKNHLNMKNVQKKSVAETKTENSSVKESYRKTVKTHSRRKETEVHQTKIIKEPQNNKKRSYIPRPVINSHSSKLLQSSNTKHAIEVHKVLQRMNKITTTPKPQSTINPKRDKPVSKPKTSHNKLAPKAVSSHKIKEDKVKTSLKTLSITKNLTANKKANFRVSKISKVDQKPSNSPTHKEPPASPRVSKEPSPSGVSTVKHVENPVIQKDTTTKLLQEVKNSLSKETQAKVSASVRQISRCSNARKKLVDLFQMVDLSLKRAATLSKIIGQKFGIDPKMIEEMTSSSEKKAVEQFLDTLAQDDNEAATS